MSAYRRVEPAISNFRRLPPPLETEIQRINEERDATIRKKRVRRKIKHALRNPLKTPQLEQTPIRLYHTRRRRSNLCIRGAEDVGAGFERSRQADDSSLGDFAASWRKEPERVQNVRCPEAVADAVTASAGKSAFEFRPNLKLTLSIYTSMWDSGRFSLFLALQLRLSRTESRLKCHFSCRQASGEHGFPLQDRFPGFDIFVSDAFRSGPNRIDRELVLPINGV